MAKNNSKNQDRRSLPEFLREHSLTIILILLLIGQLVAYWFQGLSVWRSEQTAHSEPVIIWPDYATHYMSEVWASILADTYGALISVF